MADRRCPCGHFWTEHDLYGCQHEDGCRQIDAETRFDPATKSAVRVSAPTTSWLTDDAELARLTDVALMRLLQQRWGRKVRQRLEDEARSRRLLF